MKDINKYKKDRSVCKTCFNKNKRKNNNNTLPPNKNITPCQQSIIGNVNNNKKLKINNKKDNNHTVSYEKHACVAIGPRNVVKLITFSKYLKK